MGFAVGAKPSKIKETLYWNGQPLPPRNVDVGGLWPQGIIFVHHDGKAKSDFLDVFWATCRRVAVKSAPIWSRPASGTRARVI